jgi:hypothetical protein
MKKLLLYIALFSAMQLMGQQELTLFHMNNVMQSSYVNPTAMPEFKISIGLPVVSSVYGSVWNSAFSANHLKEGLNKSDSTIYGFDAIMERLDEKNNYIKTQVAVDLFSLRFRHRWWFVTLNATQRVDFRFSYNRDFFALHNGNGQFINGEANLDNVSLNATNYREYGIGLMRHKDGKKFSYGIRGKVLFGMDNINMAPGRKRWGVSNDIYQNNFEADFVVNTSSMANMDYSAYDSSVVDDFGNNITKYAMNTQNMGLGLDLGASYKLNKKLSVTAAVNNLVGFINWNANTVNYTVNGSFNYAGLNISDLGTDSFDIETVADSLQETFKPVKSENAYRTRIAPQVFLSVQYKLGRNTSLSGTLFSEFYQGIRPAVSVALSQRAGRVLNLIASYSAFKRSMNNFGLGVMVKPGPFQIYVVGDNILGLANPFDKNFFNVRAGMNLVFVKIRKPEAPSHNE